MKRTFERRIKINAKEIASDFLRTKRRPINILFTLLAGGSLFFLFARFYPREYETLTAYLFSKDVFYRVKGKSMLPTFYDGQMWYGSPCDNNLCRNSIRRGDIIIFDAKNAPGKHGVLIKRVIGIPLDHVAITNGQVYINHRLLIEPYLSTQTATDVVNNCQRYRLGSDQLFVLGDNRSHSNDSRTFGPIALTDIWGISRFQEYNSMELLPKLDLNTELQISETECPVWTEQ